VRAVQHHVLVAEDDTEMRRLLQRALTRDHHRVTGVADGSELLQQLHRLRDGNALPDLIVCDLRMPGASGLSALRFMQEHALRVPIMLITAFCDETTRALAYGLGAWCVFAKPFDLDDLRTAVFCALHPTHLLRR
jgi:two-component system response regulator (stage 0 sporulation protein F)